MTTPSPVHIMLDLETLGTAPGSVILSIGACVFDANGPSESHSDRFVRNIVAKDAVRAGLALDADTVLWWLGQSEAARAALLAGQKFGNGATTLYGALHDLSNWLNTVAPDIKARRLWGKGPSFDCGLLAAAYRKSSYNGSELPLPWRYSNERCVRTITDVCPHIPEPPREGVHHSALDDALHQARHVAACLKWLSAVGAQTCCARDDDDAPIVVRTTREPSRDEWKARALKAEADLSARNLSDEIKDRNILALRGIIARSAAEHLDPDAPMHVLPEDIAQSLEILAEEKKAGRFPSAPSAGSAVKSSSEPSA